MGLHVYLVIIPIIWRNKAKHETYPELPVVSWQYAAAVDPNVGQVQVQISLKSVSENLTRLK